MRFGWPVLLFCASCSSGPAIPPGGIVSNNPCIDAILAEVAAPGQITAVSSYSHNPDSGSAPLDWARALPALGTSAEEIISAKPRLVLTGNLASSGTNAALAKAGVKILTFGVPVTVAESVAQVRGVALAIGRVEAGERLVVRMEAKIRPGTGRGTARSGVEGPAAAGLHFERNYAASTDPSTASRSPSPFRGGIKSAIIWQASGFVAGKSTLQDELLTLAGYANASKSYGLKQWNILPLETLIRQPPDVIFMPLSARGEDARALAARARLLRHARGQTRIVNFPDKLLFCGGPTIPQVMQVLRS